MFYKRMTLVLVILLTMFVGLKADDYPPLDNQWSEYMNWGMYIECPGTNPVQYCEVHFRYRVKKNVENGLFVSGDIEMNEIEIAENCPCEASMYPAVIKAIMEIEDAFFKPTRAANETFILPINFMTTSPCVRKHFYIIGIVKYYRWVPCEETEVCINQYSATFHQNSGTTDNAWADLTGVDLIQSASFDACTYPCTTWCYKFSVDGSVIVGCTYELNPAYTRYQGPLYVDPTPPPKISISSELVDLSIQPNPADDKIEITFNSKEQGSLVIKIIDLLGNTQSEFSDVITPGTFNSTLNSKNIPNGSYTLIITLDGNIVASEKIIIER